MGILVSSSSHCKASTRLLLSAPVDYGGHYCGGSRAKPLASVGRFLYQLLNSALGSAPCSRHQRKSSSERRSCHSCPRGFGGQMADEIIDRLDGDFVGVRNVQCHVDLEILRAKGVEEEMISLSNLFLQLSKLPVLSLTAAYVDNIALTGNKTG
ncbi:uncharacterized protein EURHEDRAFT_285197 [Aspergillus ruber CBS 135680]|uniref:Uncharacterized protein n=1 Tax=Aspergillus ruber (strain CBS 135680) TaxID=1388766 RepID=A0A017S1N2_ASPRC|nr:uncharacterized protein EURHEDRAFT_285197 [Aspergillus ruber CBS 135680]EYE90751.1 hypothetical protein EURHEDRAFT_285197 [Aspergillus ruber CBS 135680]